MTAPAPAPTTVDLLVVLTRVETKLDAAEIGRADHEQRLRLLEQNAVTSTALGPVLQDVEALKRNRWPLPALCALTGVGSLVAVLWQSSGR